MRTDEKNGQDGVGRYPVPREKWIVDQLPGRLIGFFGFRNEGMPDRFQDAIDYTYRISYPDGSPYDKPILAHYLAGDDVPTVFIIGETIELDGISFKVVDYASKRHTDCTDAGESFPYTHWEVRVVPAAGGVCG